MPMARGARPEDIDVMDLRESTPGGVSSGFVSCTTLLSGVINFA